MANWQSLLSKYGSKAVEETGSHLDDITHLGKELERLTDAGIPYEKAVEEVLMTKPKAPPVSSYVGSESKLGPRGPKSFELIPDKTGSMVENPGLPMTRDERYIQPFQESLESAQPLRDVTPEVIIPEYQPKMLNAPKGGPQSVMPDAPPISGESAMDMSELAAKMEEAPNFAQKYPKLNWVKDNKAKAITGGVVGASVLSNLLGKPSETPPTNMSVGNPAVISPTEEIPQPESRGIASQMAPTGQQKSSTSMREQAISGNLIKPENPNALSIDASDFETLGTKENLRAALEAQQNINMLSQGGKIAQGLGSAISQTPVGDTSFWDTMGKQAEQPVKSYEALVANEKNDPQSGISKLYKETLKGMGINVKGDPSASALEKQIPGLERILMQRENAAVRKEASKEREKDRSVQKEIALNNKQDKEMFEAKERAKKRLDKAGSEFINAKQSADYLNQIDPNGANGAEQISLLYNFVRGLDPRSTVREGEVSLARAGGGKLSGSFYSVLGELTMKPNLITPDLVKQLKREIVLMSDRSQQKYQKQQESEFKLLKSIGVKEDEFEQVDPYYEMLKGSPAKESKGTTSNKYPMQVRKDGQIATVKDENELNEAKQEGWN